jgi:methionyl-tRNA formyltransferase
MLIFMGTSDFACKCLESLERENIKTDMIVTRPDSVSGRNRLPSMPPMKKLGLSRGIEVWQPKNINKPENVAKLKELRPDLLVVVAYGRILSPQVLAIPPLGCINVHASLLPSLRGAAPIEWAIMRGYNETGVTTMYMDQGLDTGDIILQKSTPIAPDENGSQLRERLAAMAQELLPKTLRLVIQGTAPRTPQPPECADYAPVLDSSLERIDWSVSARQLTNHIRALSPRPGTFCEFRGRRLKVLKAQALPGSASPGRSLVTGKSLAVGTGEGLLELLEVQPEGKKIINARELINGYRIQEGEQFQ